MPTKTRNRDTLVLHGGSYRADPTTGATAVPIYQTTSFDFQSTERAERLSNFEEIGFTYSRVGNPTQDALEQRLAAIEDGAAALAVASGQAATALAVLTLVQAGDNIVTGTDLYGGTWNFFAHRLKQFGIEARFVDPSDPENFRRATDARTRLYYGETLPNPKLAVFPIREVADIGHGFGIPLIIDNTAAPLLTRPIEHGAAIVVYSATKYIGGHGTTIGGAIIDSGRFPWAEFADRHKLLTDPDPSYHGKTWLDIAHPFGPIAYIFAVRAGLLRDLGPAIAPQNAFQLIQGLETLPLRIQRHSENAARVADFLAHHSKVKTVIYPGLQTGEARRRRLSQGRLRRSGRLRTGRRRGGGAAVHRLPAASLSSRQHWRCAQPGSASGLDHPRAALARGAACRRRNPRLRAPLDRHREHRGYHRRHRPGP